MSGQQPDENLLSDLARLAIAREVRGLVLSQPMLKEFSSVVVEQAAPLLGTALVGHLDGQLTATFHELIKTLLDHIERLTERVNVLESHLGLSQPDDWKNEDWSDDDER